MHEMTYPTYFADNKNEQLLITAFSFDQSMFKNEYFWGKTVKISSASGDPPPNSRLLLTDGNSIPRF